MSIVLRSLRFVTDLANGSVSESQYALSDGVMISGGIILGNCTVPSIELSSSTTTGGTGKNLQCIKRLNTATIYHFKFTVHFI